jgi:CxxC motif-containing protein (DUF1111 family)
MKRILFGAFVLALFVPIGLRVAAWPRASETPLDAAEVAAGQNLFNHVWTANDPLAGGDGLGPVFNAASCVACHYQGGTGGSGSVKENVTTYQAIGVARFGDRSVTGILHADATKREFLETLDLLDHNLPKDSRPTLEFLSGQGAVRGGAVFSQRNTPALFGAKLVDEIQDRDIIAIARQQQLRAAMTDANTERAPVGRVLFSNGRAGKFGWKGQTASLLDFVQGACANELGLSNPNQPQPKSIARPDYQAPGEDLTLEQCKQMASFIASLPQPRQDMPADQTQRDNVHRGHELFNSMGCAVCHVQNVGPAQGIYSDLLVHRMGKDLEAQGHYYAPPSDGDPSGTPQRDEWRTPPLWGVADSGPWLHDGRAKTLEEAIRLHGGQADSATRQFTRASQADQARVVRFLMTLRAPAANQVAMR